jgi:hypothetical protein
MGDADKARASDFKFAAGSINPADVGPHVLRHSFTCISNDLGIPEATIDTLLDD